MLLARVWGELGLSKVKLLFVLVLVGLCCVTGLASCARVEHGVGAPGMAGDLLAGKRPTAMSGVSDPERITDGVVAGEGDSWRSEITSVVSSGGFVTYDLGDERRVRGIVVQADADDTYQVAVSVDGNRFAKAWDAQPMPGKHGMWIRVTADIDTRARLVRVSPVGGDGNYSIGEVAVYEDRPASWPPMFSVVHTKSPGETARWTMQLFAVVSILFLLIYHKGSPRWLGVLAVVPVGAGVAMVWQLASMWPLAESEQSYLRAVTAGIAVVAIAREYFFPKEVESHPRWMNTVLAVLAVLAVGCFYHFGMPQFRDESQHRPTLVHAWDMRVYHPVAKYFPELRFDGLYLASVAAYLDNNPTVTPSSISKVRLRDLRDNQVRTVGEVIGEIQAVRQRFTPARWEEFKVDMRYFQRVMGAGNYLGSLGDHGGNATPVWILVASMLFRFWPASETLLSLTALLDPILLCVMFYAIARTFGLRTMLVTVIVFGVTELSRFGTNLMGSTMRFDWMVALGLGVCALRTRRWMLGGILVAYAGLIRAFPAVAAMFLAAPVLWWLIDWVRTHRRLPSWSAWRTEQVGFLRAAFGVVACVGVLFAASSAVYSVKGAWGNWVEKITIHADKPNVNHVAWRTLVSFDSSKTGEKVLRRELAEPWTDWQITQLATLDRRRALYYGGMLLAVGLAIAACRRKRLDQAAMIGMLLVPVLFYPANYYLHYVFLLPLVATQERDPHDRLFGWVSTVVMVMSVALYPTLEEHWADICFTRQSGVVLLGFVAILLPLAWYAWKGGRGVEARQGATSSS